MKLTSSGLFGKEDGPPPTVRPDMAGTDISFWDDTISEDCVRTVRLRLFGGFPKWGYPQMDGL